MPHPTLFFYPHPHVDVGEVPAVSHAGAVLLADTIHATGLARSLREALGPWTKPLAVHHAAKVLLDLAMTLAVGGEVARDTDLLRCEPGLFGDVASAPTISRMITTLAQDAPAVIEAISRAAASRVNGPGLSPVSIPRPQWPVRRARWSSTSTPP